MAMAQGRASVEPSPGAEKSSSSLRKRSHQDMDVDVPETAPSKRRRSSASRPEGDLIGATSGPPDVEMDGVRQAALTADPEPAPEPPKSTPRKRGRPRKNPVNGDTPTPKAQRHTVLKTPTKGDIPNDAATPRRQAAGADRSARRKSARALIEHVVGDEDSEDEQDVDGLAREIYESGESEDGGDVTDGATTMDDGGADKTDAAPDTPSKTPKRGRKKRAKSPTPPRDLPSHELYFAQNKPGRPKTSNNTLASLDLLTHEEYFNIIRDQEDRHANDIEYLESLHAESFPQWTFELSQGFSICLYGFGSKRSLLQKFARHLYYNSSGNKTQKIVIVNGYSQTTTMRDVLTTVGLALDQRIPSAPPSTMAQAILSHLSSLPNQIITIIVNSMDAPPLRKPNHQSTLAQLAAHPQIRLVCSTDTPDFPLLWDIGQRSAFSFAFHDATTFAPFTVEVDVVDDVHELLGRKARRVNGREGVAFVLRSLPENARNLFQLLVGEVLIAMEDDAGASGADDVGVEYRMVYNKAVEEFICSSEMAFRTLLKEYVVFRKLALFLTITLHYSVLHFADSLYHQIPRSSNHYQQEGCAGDRAAQCAIQEGRTRSYTRRLDGLIEKDSRVTIFGVTKQRVEMIYKNRPSTITTFTKGILKQPQRGGVSDGGIKSFVRVV